MAFKVEITKEKIAFIQRNEKAYNFCVIAYLVYYKCFQREAFNKVVYIILVGTPHLLYKREFEFSKFSQKGGGSEFSHKKGGVGKIQGGNSRKGGVSLSSTNQPFVKLSVSVCDVCFVQLHHFFQYSLCFRKRTQSCEI